MIKELRILIPMRQPKGGEERKLDLQQQSEWS